MQFQIELLLDKIYSIFGKDFNKDFKFKMIKSLQFHSNFYQKFSNII